MKAWITSALVATTLVLVSCGGGGESPVPPTPVYPGPATLQVIDRVFGSGATASAGSVVTVQYTGWLYDPTAVRLSGRQFDTSVGKTPFTFTLGNGTVIAGWEQGLIGMKVGGQRTLLIPSSLGYGSAGVSGAIPPNSGLVFDVELLAIK